VGGEEALKLAALSVGLLAPFGVAFVLTLLELHQNQEGPWVRAVGKTLRRLARNPLILSILMGLALGIGKAELPRFFQQILRYLSGTVAPLALFSLGSFFLAGPTKPFPKPLD